MGPLHDVEVLGSRIGSIALADPAILVKWCKYLYLAFAGFPMPPSSVLQMTGLSRDELETWPPCNFGGPP